MGNRVVNQLGCSSPHVCQEEILHTPDANVMEEFRAAEMHFSGVHDVSQQGLI